MCARVCRYSLCTVESSNQLLLVAPSVRAPLSLRAFGVGLTSSQQQQGDDVTATTVQSENIVIEGHAGSRLFEPAKMRPRFGALVDLLRPGSISSAETTSPVLCGGVDFNTLLAGVPASRLELEKELVRMGAWEYEGKWMVLEPGLCRRVFTSVLQCVSMHSMDVASPLDLDVICSELVDEHPRYVVEAALRVYAMPDNALQLDVNRVARFCAEQVFRQSPRLALADLVAQWDASVPVGVTVNVDRHLRGLAFVDHGVAELLDVSALPHDLKPRLQRIFQARALWTRDEIAPYVEGVCDNADLNAVLAKHCKASTRADGVRVYASKLPVL